MHGASGDSSRNNGLRCGEIQNQTRRDRRSTRNNFNGRSRNRVYGKHLRVYVGDKTQGQMAWHFPYERGRTRLRHASLQELFLVYFVGIRRIGFFRRRGQSEGVLFDYVSAGSAANRFDGYPQRYRAVERLYDSVFVP